MSNAIVQALEDAAQKVAQAVEDAARSTGHFFEDTGSRLKTAATNLAEHDGRSAEELESAGKLADETPSIHGAGGEPTHAASTTGGSGGPDIEAEIDAYGHRVEDGHRQHSTDPRTADQFPPEYDPLHGESFKQYFDRYSDGSFNEHDNPNWNWEHEAPNNGALPGTEHPTEVAPGEYIDRYGGEYGKYLSPGGTGYPQRGLPAENLTQPYYRYRVLRPLPAHEGVVGPAFGEPGGGTQYRVEHSVEWYLNQVPPYLEDVSDANS